MKVTNLEVIGKELAIRWGDGTETYVLLERLRRACPCAGCRGEPDVMGNLHRGPAIRLTPESFRLTRVIPVGGYALQPVWADGHSSGLFSFESLWELAQDDGAVGGAQRD